MKYIFAIILISLNQISFGQSQVDYLEMPKYYSENGIGEITISNYAANDIKDDAEVTYLYDKQSKSITKKGSFLKNQDYYEKLTFNEADKCILKYSKWIKKESKNYIEIEENIYQNNRLNIRILKGFVEDSNDTTYLLKKFNTSENHSKLITEVYVESWSNSKPERIQSSYKETYLFENNLLIEYKLMDNKSSDYAKYLYEYKNDKLTREVNESTTKYYLMISSPSWNEYEWDNGLLIKSSTYKKGRLASYMKYDYR